MKSRTKVALGLLGGVVIGGTAGYFVARSRAGKRALKAAEDVVDDTDIRFPDPSFAMELPFTPDQFAVLDDLVCECGEPVIASAPETATIDEVAQEIQDCLARQLYPQFPWPTVAGDHPSVGQLYTELGVLARRAVVNAEICPEEPVS